MLNGSNARDNAGHSYDIQNADSPSKMNEDISELALSNHDHEGCYLYRHGNLGILMIKFTNISRAKRKVPWDTWNWLHATLSLNDDVHIITSSTINCTFKQLVKYLFEV